MNQVKCQTFSMSERLALIKNLVERFKQEEARYTSPQFNESSCRSLLIDPLLEAFGWDVQNEAGNRIDYRTVKVESPVVIEGMPKRTDYELCIITKPMIVLEAKKPHVNIKTDPSPAIQARRYARTRGTPIAIVTNFKEMAIYDASIKLNPTTDKSTTALIEYLTYNEYEAKFEGLYNHISYDAVLNGNFSDWAGDKESRKGAESVDDEFLAMIEKWREILAEDIALHNNISDDYDLTSPVQKIIDRIIFLRIAEGKGIESFGVLRDACQNENVYKNLNALFFKANEKYNAGLFAEDAETENLCVQDKTLQAIIFELYEPYCHYEFAVLPIEILGSVYERFLGKVVHFSRKTKSGHSIKVEEKPEVAKAGGVYYTPNYIVEYIVQQTIGEAIKEKTPEDVSKMHFLDPACGSGSFLVGAYKFLLDWHLAYYTQNEIRRKKALKEFRIYETAFQTKGVNYKLSVHEKKRILTNNIFGVDIDSQAVEVTKLSLFLKLLDDETAASEELFKTSEISQEKILPNMSANIKCGNSLIGSDFWADAQGELFDDKKYFRSINTFDWEKEFPFLVNSDECRVNSGEIKTQHSSLNTEIGFDCVIGNPPYLRVQGLRENHEEESKFMEARYQVATGRFDFYVLFMERGFRLLKQGGIASFILPHKFINAGFGEGARRLIKDNNALKFLLHFGAHQVFTRASVYTCVIGLQKGNTDKTFSYASIDPKILTEKHYFINYEKISLENLGYDAWSFQNNEDAAVLDKIKKMPLRLKDIVEYCSQGTVSMGDDIYLLKGEIYGDDFVGFSDRLKQQVSLESKIMKPLLKGDDVKRYRTVQNTYYEIYPHYLAENGKTLPYEEKELKTKFPKTYEYLKQFKKELISKKKRYKTNPTYWYALHCPRNITMFEQPKIITPEISLGCNMTYETKNFYHNTKVYTIVLKNEYKDKTLAYLAILNSKVMWFFLSHTGYVLRGGYFCFKTKYLEPFPLPRLTEKDATTLSNFSRRLMSLYSQKQDDTTKKQIAILEAQVDKAVETLYGV